MLARALDVLVADAPTESRLAGLLEHLARTVGHGEPPSCRPRPSGASP
jgi:hypothetical protein